MGKPGSRSHVRSIGHGSSYVNERRRGTITKPRTAKRHAFLKFQVISDISGWSQRAVANRYYFTYIKVYVQTLL